MDKGFQDYRKRDRNNHILIDVTKSSQSPTGDFLLRDWRFFVTRLAIFCYGLAIFCYTPYPETRMNTGVLSPQKNGKSCKIL